jgi:hypothetical protein
VRSAAPSNPSQAEEPRSQKQDVGHPLKSGRLQFDFRQRNHGPFGPPKVMKNGSCSAATVPGGTTPLLSRPERTRISYFALLATTTCAALRNESRMQTLKATGLHRKSGGAQWRDLRSIRGSVFSTDCGRGTSKFFPMQIQRATPSKESRLLPNQLPLLFGKDFLALIVLFLSP